VTPTKSSIVDEIYEAESKRDLLEVKAWVFDIQRYSVHDGPGIRTTLFLKGCPLRCIWCCNPESQEMHPQLLYFEAQCKRCYRCLEACPNKANSIGADEAIIIARERCQACGVCVHACPYEARSIAGKSMTVEEVLKVVEKDSLFYRNSGGGVTVSGGEPMFQTDFLLAFLRKCREATLHTCLETCGYVKWEVLERILEYTDMVLMDNKHMDPERHREITGVDNQLILENTTKIIQKGVPIIIRVPLIPGYNETEENIRALAMFMNEWGCRRVNLLPYHRWGANKYKALSMEYRLEEVKPLEKQEVQPIVEFLESYGLEVEIQ